MEIDESPHPDHKSLIPPDSLFITPEMLQLVDLTQEDIDHIIESVPGGVPNIQDIYALSPLQEGIMFHHLMAREGDPYLLSAQMIFPDRALLDRFLSAVQLVIERHDILRTAFIWEGLSNPAQVVWRRAQLPVTEVELDLREGPIAEQLATRFDPRRYRIDLTKAPLLRFAIAREPGSTRWLALQLQHHMVYDRTSTRIFHAEIKAFLQGQGHALAAPVPFRNFVAAAWLGQEEHRRFFRQMLGEIREPTLPFGLADVHQDGGDLTKSGWMLPQVLNDRLRAHARRLGVSLASLCHLAWGQVLARSSGCERVVFGTVLVGRTQAGEGADQAVGLFINTLPLRLDLDDIGTESAVRRTHASLAELLMHEHASLALAQRCSGVAAPSPLFSAVLNYRHNPMSAAVESATEDRHPLAGVELLQTEDRTNYPLTLSLDDFGHALWVSVSVAQPLSPKRVCGYMQQALESLVLALETAPQMPVRQLEILPALERKQILEDWNDTDQPIPEETLPELFEAQVKKTPEAIAVVYDEQSVSYGELNEQANRLAPTAELSLPNSYSCVSGDRRYKSDDLASDSPDCNLEIVGSDELQVKIRGFCVELEEIQTRLREHAQIRDAVVLAKEDVGGEKRLVAYVVAVRSENMCDFARMLRTYLAACLPEYMVPSVYVRLEELPLTANGKVDRKKLPALGKDAYAQRRYEAPEGEMEQTLAGLWQELLGVRRVGRSDNFFELGGHSLLAVRLVTAVQRHLGISPHLRDVFMYPTLLELSDVLRRGHTETASKSSLQSSNK